MNVWKIKIKSLLNGAKITKTFVAARKKYVLKFRLTDNIASLNGSLV